MKNNMHQTNTNSINLSLKKTLKQKTEVNLSKHRNDFDFFG